MHRAALCTPIGWALCLPSRANIGLRLQTGLVGENRLPLWGHTIPRLWVDTGPEPTGCQQVPASTKGNSLNLGFCLALQAHLGIVQGKLVLRAFEDSFTEKKREGSVKALHYGKGDP